ncbi:MAG TPA: hypothetical protein VJ826_05150 [Candidatus Polarisedimenticolaceae bacterium]|nr:hypothetical protein [Candidatus Polarisedimenticolaceae bacterium]
MTLTALTLACGMALMNVGEPSFADREHAATLDTLRESGLVLQEALERSGAALPVDRLLPLPELVPRFDKKLARKLRVADGWGRPLYVVQTARHLVLGSGGPDGAIDVDLEGYAAPGAIVHDIERPEADDVIWIDAILVANDLDTERARRRRTSWRLAHIASWLELRYLAGGLFPGAGRGRIEVAELVWLLEAEGKGAALPRLDAWGGPITYASDGRRFVVSSPGPGPSPDDDVVLTGPALVFQPG